MKFHVAYRCLVGLSVIIATGQVTAAPVVLTKPGLTSYIVQSRMLDADKLCLVGETMDPDGDVQDRGYVAVVSLANNKVLWQKTVEAPDDIPPPQLDIVELTHGNDHARADVRRNICYPNSSHAVERRPALIYDCCGGRVT